MTEDLIDVYKYSKKLMPLVHLPIQSGSNKLLKLIEEPAENTYFILVSENKNKILPTIYSRLQNIAVPKMELSAVSNFMVKNFQIAEPESNIIANLSGGNLNKAVVYLCSHLSLYTSVYVSGSSFL